MNSPRLGVLACLLAVMSIVGLWPTESVAQAKTANAMVQSATAFLASLTPEQRVKAVMTFDDPKYYTRPFGFKTTLNLLPDGHLLEYVCMENQKFGDVVSK